MNGCIAWLARNPIAANVMMILIVVGGLIAANTAKVEVFPEVKLDRISIQIPYLGAAPEEVESAVVGRIEEAVYGIEGVRRIVSTATGGNASERGANSMQSESFDGTLPGSRRVTPAPVAHQSRFAVAASRADAGSSGCGTPARNGRAANA